MRRRRGRPRARADDARGPLTSGRGRPPDPPLSTIAFIVVAAIAGVLSIAVAAIAGYLAWLTRRAAALGADSVPVPLTRRRMERPSAAVMAAFAVAFLAIGAGLIALAVSA